MRRLERLSEGMMVMHRSPAELDAIIGKIIHGGAQHTPLLQHLVFPAASIRCAHHCHLLQCILAVLPDAGCDWYVRMFGAPAIDLQFIL